MKGDVLNYIVLTFVSVALLLAVAAFVKERRLRLALQGILQRLLERWRSGNANLRDAECPARHGDRADDERV